MLFPLRTSPSKRKEGIWGFGVGFFKAILTCCVAVIVVTPKCLVPCKDSLSEILSAGKKKLEA